jgi:hypothetical protein
MLNSFHVLEIWVHRVENLPPPYDSKLVFCHVLTNSMPYKRQCASFEPKPKKALCNFALSVRILPSHMLPCWSMKNHVNHVRESHGTAPNPQPPPACEQSHRCMNKPPASWIQPRREEPKRWPIVAWEIVQRQLF